MKWIKILPGQFFYKSLFFVESLLEIDVLKYPERSFVSKHLDTVRGKRHYKFLFSVLPKAGGTPEVRDCILRFGPVMLFRADLEMFSVTPVIEGTGYSLAISVFLKDGIKVGLTNNFAY